MQYDFLSGIYTAVRYRYEYSHVSSTASHEENINRGDFWLGYRWKAWKLEYNYLYKHSNQIRFDNHHDDYEHNLKLGRFIAQHWIPYVKKGNVSVSKTSGERQTRFRVGLNWSFQHSLS